MTEARFTDEMLMSYADGELDEETALALEGAMEADDALALRAAVFIETRALARDALSPLAEEPVPAALTASVERMIGEHRARTAPEVAEALSPDTDRVVAFPAAPKRSRMAEWRLPLAASIAALLGGAGGYFLSSSGEPAAHGLHVAGIESPLLADALATAASGAEVQLNQPDQRFRAIATFRDAGNELCREFEVDSAGGETVISVACREADAWRIKFAVVAPGDNTGYAPASSAETLDAYLTAIEAQPPMASEEEAKALAELKR